MKLLFKLEVPSDPQLTTVVRSAVKQFATVIGFSEEQCRAITAGLDEAVTNIIRHAYRDRHDQAIHLTCRGNDTALELILEDAGGPADPEELHGRPLDKLQPGGLGMHIIRGTMDEVEYQRLPGGNRLRLVKYTKPKNSEEKCP